MEAWGEVCAKTIAELCGLLARGELSSLEIVRAYLASIAAQNPSLNVYLEVYGEEAVLQAKASDARRRARRLLSPLDGIPIALKDNLLVKGRRCTCASRMLADFTAPYDAAVVTRLRAAGMPLLGKVNLDEFSMGGGTQTSVFGPSRNPWDRGRTPGGSSGGSAAAVAAGMAPAALGSDTGGSVLQPASHCGVVGVRPAYGAVSRYGLVAFASSLDQIGPFCKTAYDAALVMNVIAGHDPKDATTRKELEADFLEALNRPGQASPSAPLAGVSLGLPRECWGGEFPQGSGQGTGLDPEAFRGLGESILRWQALGAGIKPVSLPSLAQGLGAYYVISSAQASSNLARFDGIRYGHRAQGAGSWEELCRRSRQEGFGKEVKPRVLLGDYVLGADSPISYERAWALREMLGREAVQAMEGCDGLLLPVVSRAAGLLEGGAWEPTATSQGDRVGVLAGLAGLPEVSLPCALSPEGMPLGIGLMGPQESLPRLLALAHAYERAYPLAEGNRPYERAAKEGDRHEL